MQNPFSRYRGQTSLDANPKASALETKRSSKCNYFCWSLVLRCAHHPHSWHTFQIGLTNGCFFIYMLFFLAGSLYNIEVAPQPPYPILQCLYHTRWDYFLHKSFIIILRQGGLIILRLGVPQWAPWLLSKCKWFRGHRYVITTYNYLPEGNSIHKCIQKHLEKLSETVYPEFICLYSSSPFMSSLGSKHVFFLTGSAQQAEKRLAWTLDLFRGPGNKDHLCGALTDCLESSMFS